MVSAAIARAFETIARRGDDLSELFAPGVEPNYLDARRPARIERSSNPLSIVVPDETFMLAGDPKAPTYTRNGALELRDGVLVTDAGTPILGFLTENGSSVPQVLRIETSDVVLGRVSDPRVESDGVFSYARTVVDPQTLAARIERVTVGRVALARFPASSRLERVDRSHLRAPPGLVPLVGTPNDGTFGPIAPQSRALGRLDPDAAIVRLGDAYLAARALGAAERTRYAMARSAFDLVK